MDVISIIIAVLVGAGGFFAGRFLAPNQQKIKTLKNQLAEKEASHQRYREQVADHIAGSAKKFSGITQQYRELYQHLAEGAQDLCERRAIPRELSTSHVNILAVESPSTSPQLENNSAEPVESGEPNIVDVSKSGLSPISQTNQAILDEHIQAQSGADIIDFDSQRSESDEVSQEQAKDYAVKEKGVINHNSLNRDDVTT